MKSKKCENHCPKCEIFDSGDDEIEWDIKEYAEDGTIFQSAHCNKCGCNFKEWYGYIETEWED